jgi:hypothetical protein
MKKPEKIRISITLRSFWRNIALQPEGPVLLLRSSQGCALAGEPTVLPGGTLPGYTDPAIRITITKTRMIAKLFVFIFFSPPKTQKTQDFYFFSRKMFNF